MRKTFLFFFIYGNKQIVLHLQSNRLNQYIFAQGLEGLFIQTLFAPIWHCLVSLLGMLRERSKNFSKAR